MGGVEPSRNHKLSPRTTGYAVYNDLLTESYWQFIGSLIELR